MTSTLTRSPRRLVAQRRNRARNPRVGVLTGYTASASGGVSIGISRNTGVGSPVGGACATATLNATAATWWGIINDVAVVAADILYTFSAYLRPNVAKNTQLMIDWLDVADASISQSTSTAAAHAANAWERREITATAPAGAVKARLIGRVSNGGVAGNTLQMNGLLLESLGTLGTFFDGDTPNTSTLTYLWTGAVNDSESTQSINDPADIITPTAVEFDERSEARTIAHRAAHGSTATPVFIPAGPRTGQLVLVFDAALTADAAYVLIRDTARFVFANTDVPALGMTFVVAEGDIGRTPGAAGEWPVTVPFVEVTP